MKTEGGNNKKQKVKVAHEDTGYQAGFFKVRVYKSMYVCNDTISPLGEEISIDIPWGRQFN